MINDVPTLRVVEKVEQYEKVMRGETKQGKAKESKAKQGSPCSGPQMHREITDEILKNHKKLRYPKTDSESYNKYTSLKNKLRQQNGRDVFSELKKLLEIEHNLN